MIDPKDIIKYDRTNRELEIFWLFCIMVAGKNADQTAAKLDKLIRCVPEDRSVIRYLAGGCDLDALLRSLRIGQYKRIVRAVHESADLDLRNDTVGQLQIHGVGPKTARFFVLYTRESDRVAVLDTHILRWLRERHGYVDAPQVTPSAAQYGKWEARALAAIEKDYPGLTVAEADLRIWTEMSGRA